MNELLTTGIEIKNRIISEINNAQQCIYIAMAWFTDRDIAMALIEANNRKVLIDVILSSNAQNETVKLMLKGARISVHAFETGDERGIMHHKFCLIDNKISLNGSYNYSINASNNNVENIQISNDLNTYNQFLTEFERLKYNIDNNIDVNQIFINNSPRIDSITEPNVIETFANQLNNLVFSSIELDSAKYKNEGYNTSKDSRGNVDIFRVEYGRIKERINSYATDEGLGSKKSTLKSHIFNTLESTIEDLEIEKQELLDQKKRDYDLDKGHIVDKISRLIETKSIIETGDLNLNEKGLFQINNLIDTKSNELNSLEESIVVKKFWSLGTILTTCLLVILSFYLSLFFASALFKVFFEGNILSSLQEQGYKISKPALVDANAIVKIFNQQGGLFGFIAIMFFIIPVLISNIYLFGSKNERLNTFFFWVGLVVFDIVVAAMLAINVDEVESMRDGKDPQLRIWEVVIHGEFWLMFVFGMFPLIIMHYSIEKLNVAYKNSNRDIVNAEKNNKINSLNKELIDLNSAKNNLLEKQHLNEMAINEQSNLINSLDFDLNNTRNSILQKFSELQKKIKSIYEEYNSKILSGRIFTGVVLESVISSYKSGFVEFLPEYYAPDEVANRVNAIEIICQK